MKLKNTSQMEKAGADFIVICTNTMHKIVPEITKKINIPILHIADMTAIQLKKHNIKKVGLLGTKYTMKENGIEVVIPNDNGIEVVNSVIYDELCLGIVSEKSKEKYLNIISELSERGAEGIILGCTEIGLLVNQKDTEIPLFDTTLIHAEMAAIKSIE